MINIANVSAPHWWGASTGVLALVSRRRTSMCGRLHFLPSGNGVAR